MTVIEKRSGDDRPSSALNREIRPESEKFSGRPLSGGSDSETHTYVIYEFMCVHKERADNTTATPYSVMQASITTTALNHETQICQY